METIRVGILGCGVVGGATLRILTRQQEGLARRAGARIEVVKVAVRDPARARDVDLVLESLDVVKEIASRMRVEGTSER